ncbi:pilin N-terminal domain-containing protein [Enterococcus sp. LJL120]
MIKKIIHLVSALLVFLLAIGIGLPQSATAAADNVELILHKRIYRDVMMPDIEDYQNTGIEVPKENWQEDIIEMAMPFNGANFLIYDLTDYYAESKQNQEDFLEEFNQFSMSQVAELIKEKNLSLVAGPVNTDEDAVFGGGIGRTTLARYSQQRDAVYLIVETTPDPDVRLNVDIERRSVPMILFLPIMNPLRENNELQQIHLYTKNIGYVRDPYFFKYGKKAGSQELGEPIQGVTFALYRYDSNGKKLYLDQSEVNSLQNGWSESTDPLNDEHVTKFTSGSDGLVTTNNRFLPSGTYYFEELQAAEGYTIEDEDRGIEVVIPESWEDEAGNPQYVTVNGYRMEELISGLVPDSAYQKLEPRVYNYRTSEKATATPTPTNTTKTSLNRRKILQTGEVQSSCMFLGLLLIVLAWFLWKKNRANARD